MNEDVTVNAPVSYRRWQVPDHAVHVTPPGTRGEGFKQSPTTKVQDLTPEALEALAQAWIDDLFTRANKTPLRLVSKSGLGGSLD
jgi:hypothetical protein